jgi:cyclopropane fatty-acyl-phospholipid synthase-like methyltransferase
MKVITQFPVAVNSPDHIYPWGTANDNHTCLPLINAIENHFGGQKIKFMDIGCSGGQFAVDFFEKGHASVGLEGSNYSVIHSRANWTKYHNSVLFTCDASKEYTVVDDNSEKVLFDCISSWECIEHIHPDALDQFFKNVANHMHEKSIFIGSIAMNGDYHGVELHQSLFSREKWTKEILTKYFRGVIDPNFSYLFNYATENVRWNPECIGMKNPYGLFFTAMLK